MSSTTHPLESYNVGIICALDIERTAVVAVLDARHARPRKPRGDDNVYAFGRIGEHNVVVASLPAGVMGKVSATAVAKDMMRSFPIKAGFMVGICGGVWSEQRDIRLGDVVVSQPEGDHGGVVQWDFGKMEKNGEFRKTGTLNKPPRALLNAVQSLKSEHDLRVSNVGQYLQDAFTKHPPLVEQNYDYQGLENDELFEASYSHPEGGTCQQCDRSRLVKRSPGRKNDKPRIHYGNIASGDGVVKDAPTRDRIARKEGILCFEMEAAGLMDSFPCIVIRGVCDYADSHKNKRWQRYAAMTAACYAKELLGELDPHGVEEMQLAGNNYDVPFSLKGVPAIDNFVPRDEDMRPLEEFFQSPRAREQRRIFVVHGIGGIGKTQLCVDYARRHEADFTAVFWLDGSGIAALRQSLAGAFRSVSSSSTHDQAQPSADSQNVAKDANAFLRWLTEAENSRWLLVLDNVDLDWQVEGADEQAYDYSKIFQEVNHGNFLITTRLLSLASLQRSGASLRLQGVSDDIGQEIVGKHPEIPPPDFKRLLEKLEGLPLALAQAGAFLKATNISIDRYIQRYDKTWADLMTSQSFHSPHRSDRTLLTTWKMSYEQVRRVKHQAADLLDLWAFLSPADLWYQLLAFESDEEACIASSEDEFEDILGILSRYSLATPKAEGQGFSIHPVVHAWCLHNLTTTEAKQQLCNRAIGLVSQMNPWPLTHTEDYILARRLLPHARTVASQHLKLPPAGLERELYNLARFLSDWESSHTMEQLLLRALKMYEDAGESEGILDSLQSLGTLYCVQARLGEAERMYTRALEGKEEVLGPKHTSTLGIVNGLGILYQRQYKLEKAEEMYVRALNGKEEVLGPKHISTLDIVNNLGNLYLSQGELEKAEEMYLRALEGKEEALGPKHTSTLDTVHNLGLLYVRQGKLKKAEEMYVRALEGYEEALGPKHTSTLDTVNNLGTLYDTKGEYEKVEEMFVRALEGYEEALGRKHAYSVRTVYNLGLLHRRRGEDVEARAMFARALAGYEELEGDHEKDIAWLRQVLALGDIDIDGTEHGAEDTCHDLAHGHPSDALRETGFQQEDRQQAAHEQLGVEEQQGEEDAVAGAADQAATEAMAPATRKRDRVLGWMKKKK
ncbi:hypothetical protein MBLNU230_g7317t1 [Neophaeotheca triangularis]